MESSLPSLKQCQQRRASISIQLPLFNFSKVQFLEFTGSCVLGGVCPCWHLLEHRLSSSLEMFWSIFQCPGNQTQGRWVLRFLGDKSIGLQKAISQFLGMKTLLSGWINYPWQFWWTLVLEYNLIPSGVWGWASLLKWSGGLGMINSSKMV